MCDRGAHACVYVCVLLSSFTPPYLIDSDHHITHRFLAACCRALVASGVDPPSDAMYACGCMCMCAHQATEKMDGGGRGQVSNQTQTRDAITNNQTPPVPKEW
jgi:hypothetical protein